jgi:hypothetical protein
MARPLLVTATLSEARRQAVEGRDVVLIVDATGSAGVARELADVGPGQVHLFVGQVSDPVVHEAAQEMAAELGARRAE